MALSRPVIAEVAKQHHTHVASIVQSYQTVRPPPLGPLQQCRRIASILKGPALELWKQIQSCLTKCEGLYNELLEQVAASRVLLGRLNRERERAQRRFEDLARPDSIEEYTPKAFDLTEKEIDKIDGDWDKVEGVVSKLKEDYDATFKNFAILHDDYTTAFLPPDLAQAAKLRKKREQELLAEIEAETRRLETCNRAIETFLQNERNSALERSEISTRQSQLEATIKLLNAEIAAIEASLHSGNMAKLGQELKESTTLLVQMQTDMNTQLKERLDELEAEAKQLTRMRAKVRQELSDCKSNPKRHWFLLLDESGSMLGNRWQGLTIGVKTIIDGRRHHPNELFTVITFDDAARVACDRITASQFKGLPKPNGGGTNFLSAFKSVVERVKQPADFQAYILFLTDGEDTIQKCTEELKKLRALTIPVFCVQYGGGKTIALEELVKIANGDTVVQAGYEYVRYVYDATTDTELLDSFTKIFAASDRGSQLAAQAANIEMQLQKIQTSKDACIADAEKLGKANNRLVEAQGELSSTSKKARTKRLEEQLETCKQYLETSRTELLKLANRKVVPLSPEAQEAQLKQLRNDVQACEDKLEGLRAQLKTLYANQKVSMIPPEYLREGADAEQLQDAWQQLVNMRALLQEVRSHLGYFQMILPSFRAEVTEIKGIFSVTSARQASTTRLLDKFQSSITQGSAVQKILEDLRKEETDEAYKSKDLWDPLCAIDMKNWVSESEYDITPIVMDKVAPEKADARAHVATLESDKQDYEEAKRINDRLDPWSTDDVEDHWDTMKTPRYKAKRYMMCSPKELTQMINDIKKDIAEAKKDAALTQAEQQMVSGLQRNYNKAKTIIQRRYREFKATEIAKNYVAALKIQGDDLKSMVQVLGVSYGNESLQVQYDPNSRPTATIELMS